MSSAQNSQWLDTQKITVDKTSADRTFDLFRQSASTTSAKNMENTQQKISRLTWKMVKHLGVLSVK